MEYVKKNLRRAACIACSEIIMRTDTKPSSDLDIEGTAVWIFSGTADPRVLKGFASTERGCSDLWNGTCSRQE